MARVMKYDTCLEKWRPLKLSEIKGTIYMNAKIRIDDKWIAIKDIVEDDTHGN